MTVPIKQRITLDEFEAFIERRENIDRNFELIGGEIIEVTSNMLASKIAGKILTFIGMYLLQHDIGHVTGADGGYMIGGERYIPDVAFIAYDRQAEASTKGYNPNPPDLAVEVISNTKNAEEQRTLRYKIASYMAAGVLVWVVNPTERRIEVYESGKPMRELTENDTLTADSILPDFKLAVIDIFPKQPVA